MSYLQEIVGDTPHLPSTKVRIQRSEGKIKQSTDVNLRGSARAERLVVEQSPWKPRWDPRTAEQ